MTGAASSNRKFQQERSREKRLAAMGYTDRWRAQSGGIVEKGELWIEDHAVRRSLRHCNVYKVSPKGLFEAA